MGGKAWKLKSRNKRKQTKVTNHWAPKAATAAQVVVPVVVPERKRVLSYSEAVKSGLVEKPARVQLTVECSDSDCSNDDGMFDILNDLGMVGEGSAETTELCKVPPKPAAVAVAEPEVIAEVPVLAKDKLGRVALTVDCSDSDCSNDDGMFDILNDLGMVGEGSAETTELCKVPPKVEAAKVEEVKVEVPVLAKDKLGRVALTVDCSDSDCSNDDGMFDILNDLGMVGEGSAETTELCKIPPKVEAAKVEEVKVEVPVLAKDKLGRVALTVDCSDSDCSNDDGMFDILNDLGMVGEGSAETTELCKIPPKVEAAKVEEVKAEVPVLAKDKLGRVALTVDCSDSDCSNDDGMFDILNDLGMVGEGSAETTELCKVPPKPAPPAE